MQDPCGAPDVPNNGITLHRHLSVITVNEDSVSSKLAPPTIGELAKQSRHQAIKITLKITLLDSLTAQWDSILFKEELFVHIPNNTTDNSKEAFIALLEFAEEELCCKKVIVYFDKAKSNKNILIRLFSFIGFELLPPGHEAIPDDAPDDMLYMACNIE